MPKVYGYVRASTTEQELTLVAQQERIEKEFAARFSTVKDVTWGGMYVDQGVSGGKTLGSRPEGAKLVRDVEAGDTIIITKLDRGFRNLADLCLTLRRWADQGVRLILLDLGMDMGTYMGRLVAHILGAIAEFEKERISERTKDVFAVRRAKGYYAVGGRPPYGCKLVGPRNARKLAPDPEWRAFGAEVLALYDEQGLTFENIYHLFLRQRKKFRNKEVSTWMIETSIKGERKLRQREAELAQANARPASGTPSP